MLSLEQSTQGKLDIVMVNVDNPRWQDLVDRYDVNGIPSLICLAPMARSEAAPSACDSRRISQPSVKL